MLTATRRFTRKARASCSAQGRLGLHVLAGTGGNAFDRPVWKIKKYQSLDLCNLKDCCQISHWLENCEIKVTQIHFSSAESSTLSESNRISARQAFAVSCDGYWNNLFWANNRYVAEAGQSEVLAKQYYYPNAFCDMVGKSGDTCRIWQLNVLAWTLTWSTSCRLMTSNHSLSFLP